MVFLKMGSVLVGNKTHHTKRIWPDSSQFLEFLTSKSTLGGSLILCNLYLDLKCANCAFALCIRSTWESCKLWMAVCCLYFVPMDACQYLHSGLHWWFFYSPPARWGLLDLMSVDFRLPPPSASSGPQPRPSTPSVSKLWTHINQPQINSK